MRSANRSLEDILYSPSQYSIPLFQRYYRWGPDQWNKLWQNLTDLQQYGKRGHFMGFLVFVPELPEPGKPNVYRVIDGQQRLTTLTLLLAALRDRAVQVGLTDLATDITDLYLLHSRRKGAERFRVYPKPPDRDHYIAIITGEGTAAGPMADARQFFCARVAELDGSATEAGLRNFLNLLAQRLEFVCATLEDDNAYNIFKSLNSTGVRLEASDLIRNFVFMQVPAADEEEFDAQYWRALEGSFRTGAAGLDSALFSAFLRDFLMRNGRYVPPAHRVIGDRPIFDAFEDRYAGSPDFSPQRLTRELTTFAGYYSTIRGRQPDARPEVERALQDHRALETTTTYPLLLNLFDRRAKGQLSDQDLAQAIRLVSGFILRRIICGESSRGYGELFVAACVALGIGTHSDVNETLLRFLEAHGFPDRGRFVGAFIRFNLFRTRYARHVLVSLEHAHPHKERADLSTAQVEHIMPQTLTDQWRQDLGDEWGTVHQELLHTPGNLTLSAYNPSLGNGPFSVKRQAYADSNIVMTRALAQESAWTRNHIMLRGEDLGCLAADIWPGPVAASIREPKESPADLQQDYWSGFRAYLAQTAPHLRPSSQGSNWLNFRLGKSGLEWVAYFSVRNARIGVSLWLSGARAKERFAALEGSKAEIEQEMGFSPEWLEKPEKQSAEIILRKSVDPWNRDAWPQNYQWTGETLDAFQQALGPYLASIGGARIGRDVSDGADGEAPRFQLRRRYWKAFRDFLVSEDEHGIQPPEPDLYDWRAFPIQPKHVNLWAQISLRNRRLAVILGFRGPQGRALFERLLPQKDAVEQEIGEPLHWIHNSDGSTYYLELRKADTSPADEDSWPDQHEWLREHLKKVYSHLEPRLVALAQS